MNTSVDLIAEDFTKIDTSYLLRFHRQIIDELSIKRVQVKEQKKELDTANLKIYELTKALEDAKTLIAEHQFNLNLALENARTFEIELNLKRNNLIVAEIQQKSTIADKKNLQEFLQTEKMNNYKLTQELNELKAQHQCDINYQKALTEDVDKIRKTISYSEGIFNKFESSYPNMEIANKIKACEEFEKTANFYRDQFHLSKLKYSKLEEKFIVAQAAAKRFEQLLEENSQFFQPNQETQVIVKQWCSASSTFNRQKTEDEQLINSLRNYLKMEKDANKKLCFFNAELESRIQEVVERNEKLKLELNKIQNMNKTTNLAPKPSLKVEVNEISIIMD